MAVSKTNTLMQKLCVENETVNWWKILVPIRLKSLA